MKFDKQTSTRSTSGVMSRSWLRKLICRLEKLSDNYHSHSPDHLPVVRFDCGTELPTHARTRSSSCSPSRSQILDSDNLTVRRNSSPTSSVTTPLSSQISRSFRSRFMNKRSPSSSGMYSHSGYPLFVPVDQVPRNLGKRTKPRMVGRANIYAKPGILRMGSVTKVSFQNRDTSTLHSDHINLHKMWNSSINYLWAYLESHSHNFLRTVNGLGLFPAFIY